MTASLLSLAVGAGMLAAVNPCGFAMLPTFLALFVTGGASIDPELRPPGPAAALGRALTATCAMTLGFTAVFGTFGMLIAPVALTVQQYLPWATPVIGLGLVALGIHLLRGKQVYLRLPALRGRARSQDSTATMVLYGISYAVASLSCTIGPFLALTATAMRAGSLPAAIGVFSAYAAGMGLVVAILTVATAFAQTAATRWIRRIRPFVGRAGGALLIPGGAYLAYYGWFEIRASHGDAAPDPLIDPIDRWQGNLTRVVAGLDPLWIAACLAALVLAAGAATAVRHRTHRLPESWKGYEAHRVSLVDSEPEQGADNDGAGDLERAGADRER
ncbi:MAG: cytochrome c biogenesis protein CcdA [Nonomuraea sp.]|nr:cytochrome c biogenesis protein CcdA [Nonomuraea sp.]